MGRTLENGGSTTQPNLRGGKECEEEGEICGLRVSKGVS